MSFRVFEIIGGAFGMIVSSIIFLTGRVLYGSDAALLAASGLIFFWSIELIARNNDKSSIPPHRRKRINDV